jgi:hypothetical protein
MVDAQRRRYMSDYMKKYRQNPAKRKHLKMTHRLDSFQWRVAKLLGPRYEIWMCAQYADRADDYYMDYISNYDIYQVFKKIVV